MPPTVITPSISRRGWRGSGRRSRRCRSRRRGCCAATTKRKRLPVALGTGRCASTPPIIVAHLLLDLAVRDRPCAPSSRVAREPLEHPAADVDHGRAELRRRRIPGVTDDRVEAVEVRARRGQPALVHHPDADDRRLRRDADASAGDDRGDAGAVRGGGAARPTFAAARRGRLVRRWCRSRCRSSTVAVTS